MENSEIILACHKLDRFMIPNIMFYGPQGLTTKEIFLSKHNFKNVVIKDSLLDFYLK